MKTGQQAARNVRPFGTFKSRMATKNKTFILRVNRSVKQGRDSRRGAVYRPCRRLDTTLEDGQVVPAILVGADQFAA